MVKPVLGRGLFFRRSLEREFHRSFFWGGGGGGFLGGALGV